MTRIGPQMKSAVEIVERNPGIEPAEVAKRLHRAFGTGRNNSLGYDPCWRAVQAGLITAKRDGAKWRLYPVEHADR